MKPDMVQSMVFYSLKNLLPTYGVCLRITGFGEDGTFQGAAQKYRPVVDSSALRVMLSRRLATVWLKAAEMMLLWGGVMRTISELHQGFDHLAGDFNHPGICGIGLLDEHEFLKLGIDVDTGFGLFGFDEDAVLRLGRRQDGLVIHARLAGE